MNVSALCFAALVSVVSAASLPAFASSTASSAADGASTSVSSISDSFSASSNSAAKTITAGDYKIIEIAKVADRPDTLRMTLQALDDNNDAAAITLLVPKQSLQANRIATGQTVSAHDRPYGTEFTKAENGKAFFLVLHDAWYRELQSNLVVL